MENKLAFLPSFSTHTEQDPSMDHPIVAAFDRIVDALVGICSHASHVVFALRIGPEDVDLMELVKTDTLAPVAPPLVSHHLALALANGTASILEAGRAWRAATAGTPGMEDLCSTGFFIANTQNSNLCMEWTPLTHRLFHGPFDFNLPSEANTGTLRTSLVAACSAAAAKAPLEDLGLFVNGQPDVYARAHTTQDIVSALVPFLSLDYTTVYIVGSRNDVPMDPVLQEARKTIPCGERSAAKRANTALAAWKQHIRTKTPVALSRATFFLPEVERTRFVNMRDEAHYNPVFHGQHEPFDAQDTAWMEKAMALWIKVSKAMPHNGLWRCGGIQAMVDPENDGVVDVYLESRINTFLSKVDTIPSEWLIPVHGTAWMVKAHDGTVRTVLAETPLEAAAIGWMVFNINRIPSKMSVWPLVRTIPPTTGPFRT